MMDTKSIVLLGQIGSGKTTLFNKICNEQCEVKSGGQSITRNVFLKASAYGMGFRVLDTPGFGSDTKKILHAVGVMNALSEGPVNGIFFVVRWERIAQMKSFIKILLAIFQRYIDLVTIVVTHWDTADKKTKNKDQEDFNQAMKTFNLESVMYVTKGEQGKGICKRIDQILISSKSQRVKLTDTEFYAHFDLIEMSNELELTLEIAKSEVVKNFSKIAAQVIKFVLEFDEKDNNLPDIMHALSIEIKKIAVKTIENFEKQNGEAFQKLYESFTDPSMAYLVDYALKKELMGQVSEITKMTQQKMKSNQNHFYHYIKACPHCGLIWLKVAGCDGLTTCGNFPVTDQQNNNNKQSINQKSHKYAFEITPQKVTYRIIQTTQQKIKDYKEPTKSTKRGCGMPIIWSEIPPLSEQQLKELVDPGVLDYLAKEVPKEETLKNLNLAKDHLNWQVEKAKTQQRIKFL